MKTLAPKVRSHSRHSPRAFATAAGSRLVTDDGREYVDFHAGAGALNYGDHDVLKRCLIRHLEADGVTRGHAEATSAKRRFAEGFDKVILQPRRLDYDLQFPGGADAVEAALEVARRVTGRQGVVAFTNGLHRTDATIMPYDGFLGPGVDTLDVLERYLRHGVGKPAAVIVETVQGDGVNVASHKWLRGLERLAHEAGALLIVDDTQAGCGRSGTYFSFEGAGIAPDLICLSTALTGLGLPMALTLVRRGIAPGEAHGRVHDLALVTATAALQYWQAPELAGHVRRKGAIVGDRLRAIARRHPNLGAEVRGRGLMQGLDLAADGLAAEVAARAFDAGVVVDTTGRGDRVLTVLPPLTIPHQDLAFGLDAIEDAVYATVHAAAWRAAA